MLAEHHTLDLEARAQLAVATARRVGREALAFRESAGFGGVSVESKGLQDFVTIADRQAEQSIRDAILSAFPDDGFMGEEGGGTPQDSGVWVVDPIDGTTNYVRGFRHWGVSIAFVAEGKPQIGVVYDAALDKVYSAIRGRGAQKDGRPIRASEVSDPARGMAILGHSRRTNFDDYLTISRQLYELGIDYRRMGAAAIGLVRVADGIADLYYERHLNGWDLLAGALIAHEAGAKVSIPPMHLTLGDGGPVIAAAPGLHNLFAFLREQAGPDCQPL